jgi:hypothetical protein
LGIAEATAKRINERLKRTVNRFGEPTRKLVDSQRS